MEKKLPKVFANKIEKNINNNEKIYNSAKNKNDTTTTNSDKQQTTQSLKQNKQNINQKIKEILNTKNYIYKIPVKIQINNKEKITKIIGKNQNNIITIDNELIKIDKIQDIEIYKE